jgi:hypothetical protein
MPFRGTSSSSPINDILVALQQTKAATPTEARDGGLIVQAPRITVQEVDTVRTALMHPREKPDAAAFAVSFTSACVLILKAGADLLGAPAVSLFNLTLFAVGVALGTFTAVRFAGQWRKRQPFHDQALAYVDALIAEKKAADGSRAPSPQPPSGPVAVSPPQSSPGT